MERFVNADHLGAVQFQSNTVLNYLSLALHEKTFMHNINC